MHRRAAAAALVALLAACTSTQTRADQARAVASSAGLDRAVADVVALATQAGDGTFVVTYPVTAADGSAQQVTLTQRPPDRRVDVHRADGGVESTIRTGGRSYQCSKASTWTCAPIGDQPGPDTTGVLDPAAASAAVRQLTQRAADYDFRVEDRDLLGVKARCLVTTVKPGRTDPSLGATATLCLAPTGVQLLVDVPRGKVAASEYRTDVAADAFALPAPATGSTGSSTSSTGSSTSSSSSSTSPSS